MDSDRYSSGMFRPFCLSYNCFIQSVNFKMAVGEANMIIQGLPYKQNLELQRGGRWICQKSDLFFSFGGAPSRAIAIF